MQDSFNYFSGNGKQRYGTEVFQYLLVSPFLCRTNLFLLIQEEIFYFEHMSQILIQMVCKERHHKVLPFESLSYHDHGLYLGQGF